jgi:hypothetical protein
MLAALREDAQSTARSSVRFVRALTSISAARLCVGWRQIVELVNDPLAKIAPLS